MPVAHKGNKVKVRYSGTLEDGTVFDRSEEGKPLEFTIGEGRVLPDFEKAVEGMNVGDSKTFTIDAEHAYGIRDSSLIRKFPRGLLPDTMTPVKGMALSLHLPNGSSVPATIIAVPDAEIVVDLNHPLADKDLTFEISLEGIE